MHVLFEKLRRFFVCFLTMWVSLALVGSFPVTASGQTTVIAADEGASVLLAGFHKKRRPPKIKKPPKPPPPPQKFPVPSVLYLSVSKAKDVLRLAGFKSRVVGRTKTTFYRSRRNTVAEQNPRAGDLVKRGTRVDLTRYRLKVRVPKSIGLSVSNAERILRGLDLDPRIKSQKISTDRPYKHNTVARQNPAPKTAVNPKSRVNLTIYRYKKGKAPKAPRAGLPPVKMPRVGLPPVKTPRVGKPPAPRVTISSIRNPRANNKPEVINWRGDNVLIIRGRNVNLPGNEIKGEGRTGYTLRRMIHPSCSVGPHCVALAIGLRKNLRYASVCGNRGRKRFVITEPSRRNSARGEFTIIWEPSDSPPATVNLPRDKAGRGGNIWIKLAARSVLAGRWLGNNKVRMFLRPQFQTGRPVTVVVRSNNKAVVVKPGYFPGLTQQHAELSFNLYIFPPQGCKRVVEGVVEISAELQSRKGAKETAKAYFWVAQ